MGRILRDSEMIAAPRHRHVDNVIPLHQASAATVFDQDCGGRRPAVVLTHQQASMIVGLLAQATRSRLHNTSQADEAMAWLSPHPSIGGGR